MDADVNLWPLIENFGGMRNPSTGHHDLDAAGNSVETCIQTPGI